MKSNQKTKSRGTQFANIQDAETCLFFLRVLTLIQILYHWTLASDMDLIQTIFLMIIWLKLWFFLIMKKLAVWATDWSKYETDFLTIFRKKQFWKKVAQQLPITDMRKMFWDRGLCYLVSFYSSTNHFFTQHVCANATFLDTYYAA